MINQAYNTVAFINLRSTDFKQSGSWQYSSLHLVCRVRDLKDVKVDIKRLHLCKDSTVQNREKKHVRWFFLFTDLTINKFTLHKDFDKRR